MHSLQIKALFPIICLGTPGVRWGVPEMMFATSPFERPQKEQLKPRAFVFAIIDDASVLRLLAMRNHLVY
jgi:hypothetical protein